MHLTELQLNEYLDNESDDRVRIETHLSSCDECAARLAALQALFTEIESLPELKLSTDLAARFVPSPNLSPQLPRWLTLTAALQAVLAVVAIIFAAPFMADLLAPLTASRIVPSWADVMLELQIAFVVWLQSFQSIRLPELSSLAFNLPQGISSEILILSVIGLLFAWGFGNWWLLHKKNSLV
ncbi:MAG TPA: hypothetical protein DCX53_00660 [Anaerolineae bacterium]|nr:hypothetical protein [Anaerolineae bacterium]